MRYAEDAFRRWHFPAPWPGCLDQNASISANRRVSGHRPLADATVGKARMLRSVLYLLGSRCAPLEVFSTSNAWSALYKIEAGHVAFVVTNQRNTRRRQRNPLCDRVESQTAGDFSGREVPED